MRDCLNFAQSANTFSNIDMEIQNAKVDADFEFVEKFAKMFTPTPNKLLAGNCCTQHCKKVNTSFFYHLC